MATNALKAAASGNPLGPGILVFRNNVQRLVTGDQTLFQAAALVLEREMKLELSKPGTGIKRGKHRASAPGEPPAPDTGELRSSIGHETLGLVMRVGTGLPRGYFLEYGTLDQHGFIAPRPWARTAFERAKDQMHDAVKASLKGAVP